MRRTVFNMEQRTERTTCFSGHVAMYVMALTPLTGKIAGVCQCTITMSSHGPDIPADMYMDLLVALKLLRRGHGCVAADAALPYRIRHLVLAGWDLGQRKL
jgi:hypothetical protein